MGKHGGVIAREIARAFNVTRNTRREMGFRVNGSTVTMEWDAPILHFKDLPPEVLASEHARMAALPKWGEPEWEVESSGRKAQRAEVRERSRTAAREWAESILAPLKELPPEVRERVKRTAVREWAAH